MSDPYQVVRDFEQDLCEFTGAKYAVTTNSCTMALLLACSYMMHRIKTNKIIQETNGHLFEMERKPPAITIPKHTYVGVPMSIKHAGFSVSYNNNDWIGMYELKPYPIWDSARAFYRDMYIRNSYMCLSFHATKLLGDTQGGAILHDNDEADKWLRRARFDGRTEGVHPKEDHFDMLGYHCYLSPDVAARLKLKLAAYPDDARPMLLNDPYPDLSQFEVLK